MNIADVATQLRLVGRHAELLPGTEALARVADGVGQVMVIEGEAGIGKTRLVEELLKEATGRGLRVFRGAAHELEQTLPFAAVAEALELDPCSHDPRRAAVARLLLGEEVSDDSEMVRLRVVQAVIDLIDGSCQDAPVVLVLEDIHWADPSTLLVAARLVRRLQFLQLCLVLTRRPYPEPDAVRSLLDSLHGTGSFQVSLPPLADDDVNALVHQLLGTDAGPGLARHLVAAGGNPFFITELVAALRQEGRITVSRHTADAPLGEVPSSLHTTILRRLGALPDHTVDTLRLAAVLGSTFEVEDLAVVGGRTPTEISVVLAPALRAGILQGSANRLAFRHDLIHEAVYGDLTLAMRRGLHAHAARALTAAGRSAVHVAPHLLRGTATADAEAVDRLRRAAADVGPSAQDLAVELLARAVELAGPDHPEHYELEADLAEALTAARRSVEAELLARRLLTQRRGPPTEQRTRLILADALMARHRAGDAIEHLEHAFESSEITEADRALLAVRIGLLWNIRCDLDRTEQWAAEAIGVAEKAGHAAALSAGLVVRAIARDYRGFRGEAQQLARKAAAVSDPSIQLLDAASFLGHLQSTGDDPQRGIDMLREELRRLEHLGSPLDAILHASVAVAHFHTGGWDDAATEWEVVHRIGEETANAATKTFASIGLSHIALRRDDLAAAASWLFRAGDVLADDDTRPLGLALFGHARALLEEASGTPARALELLQEAGRRLREIDYRSVEPVAIDTVRLAMAEGARATAGEAAEDAAVLAERSGTAWARASALQCRGLVEGDPYLLLEAVAVWRQTSWAPATAAASLDAAQFLAPTMRRSEGIALAEEARAVWERVGAVRELARAEGVLRELGVRRGRRGARGRPRAGWESVTDTEHKVVALVVQGLTYQEVADRMFLSRRTVETHVAHVFHKLEVSSRRELARAWESR